MDRHSAAAFGYNPDDPDKLPRGAVVCTAVLDWCGQAQGFVGDQVVLLLGRETRLIPWDRYGNYQAGRWVWMLADVRRLDVPRIVRGRQGLWDWLDDGG